MCRGEMMCGARSTALIALLCMGIISVSSDAVYVRSGSDISVCNMKCPKKEATLELYRQCRGGEKSLLSNHCYYNSIISHDFRLRLDTHSGCWKLTPARKDDSCVYKVYLQDIPERLLSSTEIRVLDPVLISNITGNFSRLDEEMAVSVQFSGEESAVTWEVDGEPLPERYRLIDDNRTLIIPSVQRDDVERTFRVRITNPVSEETREYKLTDHPMFSIIHHGKELPPCCNWDPTGPEGSWLYIVIGVMAVGLIIYIVCQLYCKKRFRMSNGAPEEVSLTEADPLPPTHNGF